MANYLGLKNKFLPSLRQYEATTGRPISDRAQQNYLYAALQTEADRKDRERQFGLQERGLNIQEKAYADQASAAKISGITQMAGLPLQGYLGYKVLQGSGLLGKGAAAATTAQGLTAPVLGTAQAATAPALATPTTFAPSMLAGETAGAAGATGAAATGTGALAAAALPAGAGFLGGKLLGGPLDKILPGGGKTGKAVGGAAGGALVGAAFGPVGAVIGGAVGFISSLF